MKKLSQHLIFLFSIVLLGQSLSLAQVAASGKTFWHFESGQVRPLAMSPDGSRLFAVNTPDNHLEIFNITPAGLEWLESVPVGLEPVAVAARSDNEVWVVNHLSDSISVLDVSSSPARVVRTLLVGDEPRDLVFAGVPAVVGGPFPRAFITTAHRGQVHDLVGGEKYGDFFTPSVGRADVWVFDADNLGSSLSGDPETIITLFGDTPRALAATEDGKKVYAGIFHSGNKTTVIPKSGNFSLPNANFNNAPEIPTIVQFNGSDWVDANNNIDNSPLLELPDYDVFEIDADAAVPSEVQSFSGVGTILFNMAINPTTGKLYISNTEANNLNPNEPDITGNIHRSQITVVDGSGMVAPRQINKHINYAVVPSPVATREKSLSTPTEMVIAPDGMLYVAAFGSSKVGVFNTAELDNDSFTPSASMHISVTGGGPSGLVLDSVNDRLYVMTRFDNGISVVDKTAQVEIAHLTMNNPEPASVRDGRRFLYDAVESSSNGEASCASCHVFGQMDDLAWDLSDNTATDVIFNPNPFLDNAVLNQIMAFITPAFHPMKGPMTTQSLRGMDNHGPMHWRGDRSGALVGGDFDDEDAAFKQFNGAFVGLLGRTAQLTEQEMQAFTDFSLQLSYPPNPIRNLDNSLTADESTGSDIYHNQITDQAATCNGCHTLDQAAGFFGTDGQSTFEGAPQLLKIAHLRNMYQKVGMFGGIPQTGIVLGQTASFPSAGPAYQPQVRGFGYTHNGTVDTLESFTGGSLFSYSGNRANAINSVSKFMLVFPSELAPVVGQQVTLTSNNSVMVGARIDLLLQRAQQPYLSPLFAQQKECDLMVSAAIAGNQRNWLFNTSSGLFDSDYTAEAALSDAQLRALAVAPGAELTYTCVPPGSGHRMALDRDMDTLLNADELIDYGSNPASIDSDGDSLSDEDEVNIHGTAPALADTDSDGLDDFTEVFETYTDPGDSDTDGDGVNDGDEVLAGTDPVDAAPLLTILSPGNSTIFYSSDVLMLSVSAIDSEDGDLSTNVQWSSSLDGGLDAAGPVVLSEGVHTVSASVSDSAGAVSVASVVITVDGIPGDIDDDGAVGVADLLRLQNHLLSIQSILDPLAIHRGDLYPVGGGDGELNISDQLLMMEKLVEQAP